MEQSAFDKTIQKVQRLSQITRPPKPSPESLQHAQEFVTQVNAALEADNGSSWLCPKVEVGEGGWVALLWQDSERYLSLLLGPDGDGKWVYNPGGKTIFSIASLDFSSHVTRGTASPDDFARNVWRPWASGYAPGED